MTCRNAGVCFSMIAALSVAVVGCATDNAANAPDEALLAGDVVVPIARAVNSAALAARGAALQSRNLRSASSRNEDFYLAVRRSALEERWFFSVYLKELSPLGPNPATLGTAVVRFREQNGKLFVFEADNARATSDAFSPDLIIDAYPIVEDGRFNSLPGSGSYVLIDPAAGQNRFSALADVFAGGSAGVQASAGVRLTTELSFVQSFHRFQDGASFEQIITTYADHPIGDTGDGDPNEFRLAATLGISLRQYAESPDFAPVATPERSHFFLTRPAIVPNTGRFAQTPVHWAFAPGKQPVKWLISPLLAEISADPARSGGADLVAAAKRGIESWNDVFGYPVFTAELDRGQASFAEDHVNYLIMDPDVSKGFAFADWRTNPITGEIRGASVYFGGGFIGSFPDDPAAVAALTAPKARTRVPTLLWQGRSHEPLCELWGPDYQAKLGAPGNVSLTGKEKLERFIQSAVAHEVGHTLGLRHNFKGSLLPPTSSIMDYNLPDSDFAQPTPGPYDRAAIKYLYGQSKDLPTQPFGTDEDALSDPDAQRYDRPTPTPLTESAIPLYVFATGFVLSGAIPPGVMDFMMLTFGGPLLGYVRAGTPAQAALAWNVALSGVRSPPSDPDTTPGADLLVAAVFKELYLRPLGLITVPPTDTSVVAAIAADGKAVLVNPDGRYSLATRRLVVDALKEAQNDQAYFALGDARDALTAKLGQMNPSDRALTQDLVSRITAAITPYFK